jgi:tetratricopeptide (TPR) repeat protein
MSIFESNFQPVDLQSSALTIEFLRLVKHENWEAARTKWVSLRPDQQNQTSLLVAAADMYESVGDFPAALKCLHQACDLVEDADPILFDIYKGMGNLYLKAGDADAAEEKYNQAYGLNDEDESLLVNYGVLAIQREKYDKARDRFSQVIHLNKSNDVAWVGLALVHRACSDHELARACLLRALDENQTNKIAMTQFYDWCEQDGVDAGQDYLQAYIEKKPEDQEVRRLSHQQRQ